jgi:16S rRNA processing protein RimM
MDKNECFQLGYIAKRIGNNGDVSFILDVDDPKRYLSLETVFIELNNSLVPFFIKKIQLRGNDAVATIEGIDSIEKAEGIAKSSLYLPLSFLPPLKGKQFYFHEVVGYKVKDNIHGDIGIIEEVLDYPQQVIFQIRNGENEILIPAKEEFIDNIDRANKQINICAPEGLIDIYLNKSE